MREDLRDSIRLEHIIDAINRLTKLDTTQGIENIIENSVTYFGVVKLLEIIGEAAYMLTKDFVSQHPETPWRNIIGMRHILVHGYYQVDYRDVVQSIKINLLPLKTQIEEYLTEFE